MKFKLIPIALILSQSVFALNETVPPEACPSVRAIKAVGVNQAIETSSGWFATNLPNDYGMQEEWQFYIEVPNEVEDDQDAVGKGSEAVYNLSPMIMGPLKAEDDHWLCIYSTKDEHIGVAVTPADIDPANMLSRFKLK